MREKLDTGTSSPLKRRRYLELLGVGTVGSIAGCTGNNNSGSETSSGTGANSSDGSGGDSSLRGGHLRISITPETTTINPVMMESKFPQRWGVKLFYSTLTRVDPDLKPYGDLAKDWSANNSADEWTFTLRDATFHNNGDVTGSDVKATFETVYDDNVGSPGNGTMGDIKTIKVPDKKTVKFTLKTPNSDFPKLVSKGWGAIVPEDIVTDSSKRKELGTKEHGSGAFTLESFSPGSKLVGVAYDDYYRMGDDDDPLPYVDKVTQTTIPEKSNQVNALRSGDVDLLWQPGYSQWDTLQGFSDSKTHKTPGGEIATFVMNTNAEPWSDKRVREAVMWATDRKAIMNSVTNGLGSLGQDSPLSPAYEYYTDVGARSQNINKAKKLLSDAGYPNGVNLTEKFGMKLKTASSIPHMRKTAVLMKEQLSKVGIEFDLETMTYSKWNSTVWKKSPFYVGAYGMRISGANFMKLLLSSNGGWNGESNWSNDKFDTAINNAISETDTDKKQQYMKTAQQIARDEGPYMIPFYIDTISATKTYVKKYALNPLAYQIYPDEYALSSASPTK